MAKPIIVFYINVGNIDELDIALYMDAIRESTSIIEDDYHRLMIPVRGDSKTKIELLSTNIIVSDNKEINKLLQKNKRLVFETEQLLKRMPSLSKNILLIEKTYI